MKRVAVNLFTGFLGSGKTTLLRALLEAAPSRERIAVIVNEIGDIGIDGRVLTGFEHLESVVELAGGCICCSIDEYRFDFAIEELLREVDPTLLLIETTGVADPGPAIERIARAGLGLDAVITVVDAEAWSQAWRVSRVARRQVEAADFLVVSKTDLVPPRRIASLRRTLARLNPRALVLESVRGALSGDAKLLTAAGVRAAWTDAAAAAAAVEHASPPTGPAGAAANAGHAGHAGGTPAAPGQGPDTADAGMQSFVYRSPDAVDRAAFERALADLPPQVFRAKGFARATDGRPWLFHYVCGRTELSLCEVDPGPGVQGVFIGRDLLRHRPAIEAALCKARKGDCPL